MAQSSPATRGKLIDELVDDVTRTALRSANLTAEDRVLARQRVQQAIGEAAEQAHGDVLAFARSGSASPEARRFIDYIDNTYEQHIDQESSPARKLAAEMVTADDRTNGFAQPLAQQAEYYVAHSITVAGEGEARKSLSGAPRSSTPGAARQAASGAAAKTGTRTPTAKSGPSIG